MNLKMSSFDLATVKPSLLAHLAPFGALSLLYTKTLPIPWRQFGFVKQLEFNTDHLHIVQRGKLFITSVSILETKCMFPEDNGQSSLRSSSDQKESGDSEELEQVDDKERLRRKRISKANRGNTPWNKGRKHSPETIQKIRERTKIAMQNPKIKMKLASLGRAQSEETRLKIAEGVRLRWKMKNESREVQETCYCEWKNLIAETARRGYTDEEELQWDSYNILVQKLRLERKESKEQRRVISASKGNRRAPKSLEQRRKIAEAIAAKWADPAYRESVCSGLAKYYGIPAGSERRHRKPRGNAEGRKRSAKKRSSSGSRSEHRIQEQLVRLHKQRRPVFKDPLASSKLEMIKSIRAKRVAEEAKKKEAVERARLLIMEAEKAAKVLELAALRNPLAQASLLESRKLIAKAIQLIESIELRQTTSLTNLPEEDMKSENVNTADHESGHINGAQTFPFDINNGRSKTSANSIRDSHYWRKDCIFGTWNCNQEVGSWKAR